MKPYLLSAKQLVDKVKKSELSSVEVANSFIERIEEFEKKVHAWAFFDKTSLLEKAKEADPVESRAHYQTQRLVACFLSEQIFAAAQIAGKKARLTFALEFQAMTCLIGNLAAL